MKALHFLEIFMFALRWHQAEAIVQYVAAELFLFNQVQHFLVTHTNRVSDFNT